MECLLCTMWNKMPYGKRYTTPTTVGETEGALVIGYWAASRRDTTVVAGLCERHMAVVNTLDAQEETRKATEAHRETRRAEAVKAQQASHTQNPFFQQRLAEVSQQREMLVATLPPQQPVSAMASPTSVPLTIGPGALGTRDNPLQQPIQPTIETGFMVPQVQGITAPIMEPNMTQVSTHAAALIDAPCLFCKVMVLKGEVHACPQARGSGT